jgi:hypothetical protein
MGILIRSVIAVLALMSFIFNGTIVQAGWMDKINAAAQKLNEKSQQMPSGGSAQQPEDPDHPLHLEDHDKTGSCEGKRSATCMDYMELMDHCMDPVRGYRMKVLGDRIEKKLKTEKLSDKERKNLEEDLAGAREAEKNKSDDPTIAGEKKSQRYLSDISEEDQVYVNAEYNRFNSKISNKCLGADHMQTGHRTEFTTEEGMTGEQAVAELKKQKEKDREPFDCIKKASGIRFRVMADMMEDKMKTMKLSAQEQKEWQEDIDLLRNMPADSKTMPQSPDPKNPMRYMMRLSTPEEQLKIGQESSKQSQEILASCSAGSGSSPRSTNTKKRDWSSGGLVDHSTSPANKEAEKQQRKDIKVQTSIIGANNLTAMKGYTGCFEPLKGHLAKVTADALEKKLKSAQGISDQKRKDWKEDIAAWRTAQAAGADAPTPPDPNNPYRWYDYVTNQERAQINKEHAEFNNKIMKECGNRPSGL